MILAMVSCGLGISIMEELMLDRNEYPVVACSCLLYTSRCV